MNANDVLEIRRAIGDTVTETVDEFIGVGTTAAFPLTHPKANIRDVYVSDEVTTDYTYENGVVTLNTPLETEAIMTVKYSFGAYSDEELADLLTRYGKTDAIIECLKELLAGSARLTDYQHGQTTVKGSQKFAQLKSLLDMYLPGGILNNDGNGVSIGDRSHPLYQRGKTDPLQGDLTRTDRFDSSDVHNSNMVA